MLLRAVLLVSATGWAQGVTFDRILHPDREPQNWLTYSGTVGGQRYSPLTQITPANVKNLELQWVWQARSVEKFETTALVVDGILYTVQAPNDVYALDAVTGRIFWTLPYTPEGTVFIEPVVGDGSQIRRAALTEVVLPPEYRKHW